ncbi:MAG: dihydroorotate dehydrogenase electron transfer subunit [Bacillota bacterium]|nr:dihydroorotate dehydrogenase electron transfer subunit [Bacillota bacterium]
MRREAEVAEAAGEGGRKVRPKARGAESAGGAGQARSCEPLLVEAELRASRVEGAAGEGEEGRAGDGPGVRLVTLTLAAPELARRAEPGQFLLVRTALASSLDPLLRRPFSVCDADPERGEVRIHFQVVGRGTAFLAERRPGERLDVLGPLGRGFSLPRWLRPGEEVLLVGGGAGAAPLPLLALRARAAGLRPVAFLGAATLQALPLAEVLRAAGAEVHLATLDGSAGRRGTVVEALEAWLAGRAPATGPRLLSACGPRGMLLAVARLARRFNLPCQVSLEERMACGLGACLGCHCGQQLAELRAAAGWEEKPAPEPAGVGPRVCADGPVFWLRGGEEESV